MLPLSEHVTDPQLPEDPDGILVYGKGSRFAKSFLIKELSVMYPEPYTGQNDTSAEQHEFAVSTYPFKQKFHESNPFRRKESEVNLHVHIID